MRARYITDLHEEIAKELIGRLKRNPQSAMMSYGDLCRLVDNKTDPRNVAGYIGDLSVWCWEIGAPMISALIYNRESGIPGKGFFELYSDLYEKGVKKDDEDMIFVSEVKKVLEYKQWDKLEKYLGL